MGFESWVLGSTNLVSLDTIKFALTFAVLMAACYYDVKVRRVPGIIWNVLFLGGIILNVAGFGGIQSFNVIELAVGIMYIAIVGLVAWILNKFHVMGGAEANALVAIQCVYPLYPRLFGGMPSGPLFPIFALSVFLNALFCAVPVGIKMARDAQARGGYDENNPKQKVPFIVFLTIGYLMAIAYGDVLLTVYNMVMSINFVWK